MPTVRTCRFADDEAAIRAVRVEVFVDEQGIAREEEFDDADDRCVHVVVRSDGMPVGTGRLDRDGRIGRIAVLAAHRRRGLGRTVMVALERAAAAQGSERVYLGAQVTAVPFYERLGYRVFGEPFVEAGIPHRLMEKTVAP
ncbi:MAG: GNAT family N-acetyltransferase [Phycisphaerales bacterium]|nr:GNAT family N-acetyltransferase [Phycisphaerales bacterium]